MAGTAQGGCWPTARQQLLLKACLLQGPACADAFREWRAALDFDNIDYGSERLIPLLHDNLQREGIDDSLMGKFGGLSRHAWYRNQLLFRLGAETLRHLQDHGIETMVLKGAALGQVYYGGDGLRPMADFDLMVPAGQVAQAFELFEGQGWTLTYRSLEQVKDREFTLYNSQGFLTDGGFEIDLHWHLTKECLSANVDGALWDAAVPLTIQGVPTLALCPADQLLHVCTHGLRWNTLPPLRWIADAHMIVTRTPDLDWDRLLHQAQERQLSHKLHLALRYLAGLLGTPVPSALLDTLEAQPASRLERFEYYIDSRPPTILGRLPDLLSRYIRKVTAVGGQPNLLGFARHVQHYWHLQSLAQLPYVTLKKGLARLGLRGEPSR